MVDSQGKRRDTPDQKCHTWSEPLTERCFVPIGHNVFVASPALCYLQVASSMDMFDLIELGYELCGGYSRTPGIGKGFVQRYDRLAQPKQIERLLDKLSYASGCKRASRAIKRVLPNSMSPAETDMSVKVVLPLAQGGYGFPHPELNAEVPLTEEASLIAGQPVIHPDALWRKERTCLEYDSSLHHERASDRTHDSIKRNALGCMGFNVITVTPTQLKSVSEFDGIAKELARYLGVRLRITSRKTLQMRYELNEAICRRIRNDLKPREWPYC